MKKYSLRILVKHAGSQLKTKNMPFSTWERACSYANRWIDQQFIEVEFFEPFCWRWTRDETDRSLSWCDRATIPGPDETHFLFRISIKEVEIMTEG